MYLVTAKIDCIVLPLTLRGRRLALGFPLRSVTTPVAEASGKMESRSGLATRWRGVWLTTSGRECSTFRVRPGPRLPCRNAYPTRTETLPTTGVRAGKAASSGYGWRLSEGHREGGVEPGGGALL